MLSLKSEITQKLLNFFFLNPEESLYVNELARKLFLDKRNLMKKVKELESDGLLISEEKGNLKLLKINREYPLYDEYRKIVLKTVGVEAQLKRIIVNITGVEKAIIFGSYAADKMEAHSDIDLLVVGDHDGINLQSKISILQRELDRIINLVNISSEDFNKRLKKKDPFLADILKRKHILIK